MKKEYLFIFSVVLIGLAFGIDFVSGKINLLIKNPYQFFDYPIISKYPLTSLGIFCRAIGLFILTWIIFSLIKEFYFKKVIALFVIFVLGNLYSIQQLATGMRITPVQWTISIAYASALLLIPLAFYLIKSTTVAVVKKVSPKVIIPKELPWDQKEKDNE